MAHPVSFTAAAADVATVDTAPIDTAAGGPAVINQLSKG
jgi:hypothetical protein